MKRRTLLLVSSALAFLILPTLVSVALARGHLVSAEQYLLRAKGNLKAFDLPAAESDLKAADASLRRGERLVDSPINFGGLLVPIVSENLTVLRAIADSSGEAIAAGQSAIAVLNAFPRQEGRLVAPWREGAVNLEPFRHLEAETSFMRSRVEAAAARMSNTSPDLLLPAMSRARSRLTSELVVARAQARAATGAAFLIPRMLGDEGARRWIIGAENIAELRGRGGYVGSFGVLETTKGRMALGDFVPVADLPALSSELRRNPDVPPEYREHYAEIGGLDAWPNLFMSPSFPSGASLFARQLKNQVGISSDGVISIDPIGLSYLMEVTGPVTVEGFPEPLTSENVVEWSLSRLYSDLEQDQDARREQSSKIAEAVWRQLTTARSLDSRKLSEAFGRALAERRMVLWSKESREQSEIEKLGIGGTISQSPGDYLMLVSQNFGENKLDYYLERSIELTGRIRSDGSLLAETKVTVTNTASTDVDLPGAVGGERPRLDLASGTARSFLKLFVHQNAVLTEVLKDGEPTTDFENSPELGKRRFAVYAEVAPRETQEFRFRYLVPDILDEEGYDLTVQSQSTVRPDRLRVDLELPAGARLSPSGTQRIQWSEALTADKTLHASIDRTVPMRIAGIAAGLGSSQLWLALGLGVVLTLVGISLRFRLSNREIP
ncbi:MAG: DUF4012 domain-containing protein [Actinobacteria bacterium]|nr:DUF4012 domain-containing protein [Actinomycetota bacterium]